MSRFSSCGSEKTNRSSAVTTSSTSWKPCEASRSSTDETRSSGTEAPEVTRTVDELDVRGGFASGTDDLFVTFVPDEQDVVVLRGVAAGLLVHLGHQRAGGVDGLQVALAGLLVHLRRHAVRREDHDRPLGYLLVLLDEDRTLGLQRGHHVPVVHDLLPYVDRRTVELERLLDGLHRPVDTGTVAAGPGEQHALSHQPTLRCAGDRARERQVDPGAALAGTGRQPEAGRLDRAAGLGMGGRAAGPDQPPARYPGGVPHVAGPVGRPGPDRHRPP